MRFERVGTDGQSLGLKSPKARAFIRLLRERGYVADLVLVDGDPVQDITHLRRASLVIQGRVAYAPDQLYEATGFKPFVPAAKLVPTAQPPAR